jgi:hypothetical protein
MPTPMKNFLNRYTSFASLLAMLQNREITLLSPGFWEDRNDAYYMSQYKSRKELGTLLALCFSQAEETYHHWRVFTHGADGVCITFRRAQLLHALGGEERPEQRVSMSSGHAKATNAAAARDQARREAGTAALRFGPLTYRRIADLPKLRPKLEQLPFLKRQPYQDEREFRLVYEDKSEESETKAFPIPLACISRVTLNPWLAPPLAAALKTAIKDVRGCSSLKVYQTTLLENETWKKAAKA